jgi:hypothetical protein
MMIFLFLGYACALDMSGLMQHLFLGLRPKPLFFGCFALCRKTTKEKHIRGGLRPTQPLQKGCALRDRRVVL